MVEHHAAVYLLNLASCRHLKSACTQQNANSRLHLQSQLLTTNIERVKANIHVLFRAVAAVQQSSFGFYCSQIAMLQALKQSTTAQKQQYESWRKLLLQCLANVEAVIDFGEDEGIAEEVAEQVLPRVQQLRQLLQQHLTNGRIPNPNVAFGVVLAAHILHLPVVLEAQLLLL